MVVSLKDVTIDKGMTEASVLREVFLQHVKVDHYNADALSYLRSSKAYTRGSIKGLKHVLNKLLQIRIINRNILCHFRRTGWPNV